MTETVVNAHPDNQQEVIELSAGWAAIRKGVAVAFLPMRKFNDIDFDQYLNSAKALLGTIGTVKTGNLGQKPDGTIVFLGRLNHDRRSTSAGKRRPEFPVTFLEPRLPK